MSTDRILVIGANGNLGRSLLYAIGRDRAVACTRPGQYVPPEFEHITFNSEYGLPTESLTTCRAIINAAGKVRGSEADLEEANVSMPTIVAQAAKRAGVRKLVQVSSFSIFGNAERVGLQTAIRPFNSYGKSKARCETQLLSLADNAFAIECVRLPFMFSSSNPALIGPLFKIATMLRCLPEERGKAIHRSMITYPDAARQLFDCAQTDITQFAFASDPRGFDYTLVKTIFAEEAGLTIRILPISSAMVAVLDVIAPSIGRRLFHSSILQANDNLVRSPELGIESELRTIVRSSNLNGS